MYTIKISDLKETVCGLCYKVKPKAKYNLGFDTSHLNNLDWKKEPICDECVEMRTKNKREQLNDYQRQY